MNRLKLIALSCTALALIGAADVARAGYYGSLASGDWTSPGVFEVTPGEWDTADISHVVTIDAAAAPLPLLSAVVVRGGGELRLNGNDISTWYSFDVQGLVSGAGTVRVGPGDGLGGYDGGVITSYFDARNINMWTSTPGFTVAHGKTGWINWLSGNTPLNVVQSAGQRDGLEVTGFDIPDGSAVNLTFDAGASGSSWALRVPGDQVAALNDLHTAAKLNWSGLAGVGVFDGGDGFTYVGLTGGPVAHLTANPASGAPIDYGHLAVSTASTTTTISLTNDGEAGSTIDVTGGALTSGTLFALTTAFAPATLTAGGSDTVSYGVKFLGSPTPGPYSDTLTFTTSAGSVSYTVSAVVDVPGPHMGDANHDKKVDLQDFSLLKAYYGQTGQPWEHGNFNNDATGLVNLEDFSLLKAHYNHTGDAADSPLTTVPEPGTMSLLLLGVVGLVRARKNRR